MKKYFLFFILFFLKFFSKIFYRTKIKWCGSEKKWKDINLILLLNHTSLFEFIYISIVPYSYLWKLAKNSIFPVADITYNRKFIGKFFRMLGNDVSLLSRKRDNTWSNFLSKIRHESILIFLPEGRMKRKNGLDKNGNKMTVRRGVYDVIEKFKDQKMLIVYSKGLHHVLAPGDMFPKIFKKIEVQLEKVDISEYRKSLNLSNQKAKILLCEDLENRRDKYCLS